MLLMLTNHSVYRTPPEHGCEYLVNIGLSDKCAEIMFETYKDQWDLESADDIEFGELLDVFLDTETGAFYAVNSDRDEYSEVNLEDPMGIESNWRDIQDDGSVVLLLSPPDIGLWSPSANETK